ncbi:MAG: LysR substrate-binding domain-containing protein [Opitutaceae bacterium]|jgi:DNA-binding transcriptional LysR family regulator
MELRHLRYFQSVAENLSFSRAAERLGIAQPAISRQITALEQEIGVKLFVRTTTRVRLTDAGRRFHQDIDRLLSQLAIAVTGAQRISGGSNGELNLGSDWRVLFPQIPEAVMRYRAAHPHVTVNFIELQVHAQIQALRDGLIHIGFVHKLLLSSHPDLASLFLFMADFKVIVGANHPLAGAGSVAMRELKKETWVKLDEKNNPGYRAIMLQLCHPALFTPRFGRGASSIEGMLALVTMGDGICILPSSLLSHPHPGLCLLDTDCPPLEFYAIWLKDNPSRHLGDFIPLLKKTLAPPSSTPKKAKKEPARLSI